MISIQGNKTSIKKVHVCKSLHCFMQLQKSHNPEQQRNELCLSVRSGWRNERYAVGFFFFPACSGPPVGKGEGSWRGGLTQINLCDDVTRQTPQAALFRGKTSTLSWVSDTVHFKHFYYHSDTKCSNCKVKCHCGENQVQWKTLFLVQKIQLTLEVFMQIYLFDIVVDFVLMTYKMFLIVP